MLRLLTATDSRFKSVEFKHGLNLLIAERTATSADTDTRNGAGKSSLIEILHFLLGGSTEGSILLTPPLREITFHLRLDWPGLPQGITVGRRGADASTVTVEPDIRDKESDTLFPEPARLAVADWQRMLESQLFGLSGDHPGISGRVMLSFLMRRTRSNAFNEPARNFPQQSYADASTNLSYMFGLDWQLANKYRDLAAREAARRKLIAAVRDPVFGRIVGRSSELRGQVIVAEDRVRRLADQAARFQVVPRFEEYQREADEIGRRIRQSRALDTADQRNLVDIERALAETSSPEVDYLEDTYSELGILFSDQVRRRFEEVSQFHESVIRNRREYLADEAATIRNRVANRAAEREQLGARQAEVLRMLSEGGALDSYTAIQQSLSQERATLEALKNRLEAALALEASRAEITGSRANLQRQMKADLEERQEIVSDATLLFLRYAQRLYGPDRRAFLEFDARPAELRIVPRIESDPSRGIRNMVIFCFDLALAVVAHRAGRGPDFLVHDSHLFDGVDERQVGRALDLGREVSDEETLQYIVTLNSDEYDKARRQGFNLDNLVIPPRLTDEFEDGGLFGFRF